MILPGERNLYRAVGTSLERPATFSTGFYVTGPDGNGPMTKPRSEEEARQFVRDASRAGATGFKLYRHVEPNIARAVISEAYAQGRKVTG